MTADAKRCRKNSDPAASQALLGSTFACPGEPSQSNKEASGQRDERPLSTAEHPDHDFVLSEPSLAVVMDQSLVPGWSAAVVIGDGGGGGGGGHHLPCCVMEVMCSSSPCMPMKSMAVQILAGSMACVCHTVI